MNIVIAISFLVGGFFLGFWVYDQLESRGVSW